MLFIRLAGGGEGGRQCEKKGTVGDALVHIIGDLPRLWL